MISRNTGSILLGYVAGFITTSIVAIAVDLGGITTAIISLT